MKTIKNSNPYRFDFSPWLYACEKLITICQKKLNHYKVWQNQYQTFIKKSLETDLNILQEKYKFLKKLADTADWLSYHRFDEPYNKDLVFAYLYSQGFIKELYESAKHTFDLDDTELETAPVEIFNAQVVEFAERIEDAQFNYSNQIESLLQDYNSSSSSIMGDLELDNETTDKQTALAATYDSDAINGKFFEYCELLRKQYVEPSQAEIANREQQKASDSINQLEQKNKQIKATLLVEQQNICVTQNNLKNKQDLLKNLEAKQVTIAAALDFRYKACLWLKNSRNPFIKPIQYFFGMKINNHVHKVESAVKNIDNEIQKVHTSIQTFENALKASQTLINKAEKQVKHNKSQISILTLKLNKIASLQSRPSEKTEPNDRTSQIKIRRSAAKLGY